MLGSPFAQILIWFSNGINVIEFMFRAWSWIYFDNWLSLIDCWGRRKNRQEMPCVPWVKAIVESGDCSNFVASQISLELLMSSITYIRMRDVNFVWIETCSQESSNMSMGKTICNAILRQHIYTIMLFFAARSENNTLISLSTYMLCAIRRIMWYFMKICL